MSVPGGLDQSGLPLGLQVIGRPLDEQGVLNACLAIEERAASRRAPAYGGDALKVRGRRQAPKPTQLETLRRGGRLIQ